MLAPVLSAESITKRFGEVAAVDHVSFDVFPGEIHALCGENGAGKSTLMKILSGQHPYGTYEGVFRVNGNVAQFSSVRDAEQHGICIVHQELSLIDSLSVAENIMLGSFPRRMWGIDWLATNRFARQTMELTSAAISPHTKVANLGIGHQQLIEIARALAKKPNVLILDEPTTALTEEETLSLLAEVLRLKAKNVACIYISHKLDEVQRIADRITILRDGASVITSSTSSLPTAQVIKHMVGREIKDIYPPRHVRNLGEIVLEVKGLHATGNCDHPVELKDIHFQVRAGEVLGIGGLLGAGRSELLMHIYGMWGTAIKGEVYVNGTSYRSRCPSDSIGRGITLITENRKRHGILAGESVNRNLSISSLKRITRYGKIDAIAEYSRNAEMLAKLHFRALSTNAEVRQLSGGNQQKVVLGRALLADPQIVLLDEPTRGVDVGARREIYDEIHRLARIGKAIVMVSSELPELMGLSDRIVMIHDGRISESFDASMFDQDQLMEAALGKYCASDVPQC